MKTIIIAAVLAVAPMAAHAADSFTFVTTGKAIDGVRVPSQGPNFEGAQITTFSVDVTYGDGHKDTATGKCSAWRNPPGSRFEISGVCVAPGAYEQQYSCKITPKNEQDCWGALMGTGGRFAGRTGLVTYHSAPNRLAGEGQWND